MRITQSATKAAVALAASLMLSLAGLLPAHSASPPAPDREIRIINYNIQHGRGMDGVVDLDRIAGVIRDSGAQIVTLQEVDRHLMERSNFEDQARELGRKLNMHVAYGANIDWDPLEEGQPRRQYGTAILSRFPILDSENILLPIHGIPRPAPEEQVEEEWSEPRGVLKTRINIRGVRVHVYTTHLQSPRTAPSPESAQQQRAEQILTILDEIAATGGLTILTGDMNAEPDTPEMEPLYEAMVDVWDVKGEGPGLTAYLPELDRRIDYVFVSPEIGVHTAEVPFTEASDHLPVLADLSLPGSAVGAR